MNVSTRKEARLVALREALDSGTLRPAQRMVAAMHPAEIALLLESVPPRQRELVWGMVDPELEGDVLVELNENVRQELIGEMATEELVAAAEGMELDDLADLVGDLPETVTLQVLRSMDQRDRERLRNVLSWPEDSAGGLMNTDTVSVRADVTLEVVLRYLRMRGELPARTDSLFVVDRDDHYLGTIALTRIITGDPEASVGESLDTEAPRIEPETAAHDVAQLFQDRDLVSAAVVGVEGRLLGRITIDDVVDVIRQEAEHSVLSMAGLQDEEDLFAGIVPSTRRRLLWLGINLVTAFLAAAVVKSFEGTIEKVAALAALMPIVASMGGIAGTQTVTLIIRGLALGQVQWDNARWLLFKEIAVGGLNGLLWALVVGVVTVFWFDTWQIAGIIAAAMLINLLAAAAVGVLVPLALRRLDIDPALSAGVIITTFTDCIGFATLLGLGALFLT
ncbi:MAG: magnesium transporter [Gammaproteobacteria bacterium]|jgi:magnesium transporter|nr:magnesium transporter [Gammaproteobacteria bacterium]NBP07804.1 magnesium transporter [Gammaproteobacteria bacterium]NBR17361.1 magnesium transporter [Gammaproteobacteria bacterium]NCW20803.1 magnesium transporter [Gammaproteobacteria bacterium]NDA42127.1 magnesium transporter [Gammaproteobacteria bacterium]